MSVFSSSPTRRPWCSNSRREQTEDVRHYPSHNESPCCNRHRNFPTSGHSNIIYIVKTQDIAKLLAYLICSTSWLSKNYSSKWTWLVWIFTKPWSSELIIHCNPPILGRRDVKLQGLKDCRQPAVGPLGALEANSYVIFNQALLR